jgi:hypothetical protein
MHPSTIDADIVAAIRGAYRLLNGMSVKDLLGISDTTELAELRMALATSEAKLQGAVEYCNELKLEIQRLQHELETAKPSPKPAAPKQLVGTFSKLEAICIGVAALFAIFLIGELLSARH